MGVDAFLGATRSGVARVSRSASGRWAVDESLQDLDVRCVAVDPLEPRVAYAGTQGDGIFRSGDGGTRWRPGGLSGAVVKSLAVSSLVPGTVYAGTKPPLVFRSRDGGRSWNELEGFRRIRSRRLWFSPAEKPFTAYVQALALSPTDAGVVLAGIEFGAVVRSADGGETWTGHRRGALRDCHSLVFHAADGDWLYEGAGTGVAVSRDAGISWDHSREGLDRRYCWAAAADPTRPEVRYVSAAPGPSKANGSKPAEAFVFRAIGGGAWEKLGGGLPEPLDHMPYALLTDPGAPGHVYAGLTDGELWESPDLGETWTPLPVRLPALRALVVARPATSRKTEPSSETR